MCRHLGLRGRMAKYGQHQARRTKRFFIRNIHFSRAGMCVARLQCLHKRMAQCFTFVLRHHDEAPGTDAAMVRRLRGGTENQIQCIGVRPWGFKPFGRDMTSGTHVRQKHLSRVCGHGQYCL